MLLRTLLVVTVLAGTAAARDVKTGTTARVTRVRSDAPPVILWAMMDGQHDARIIGLNGWMRPATYAIVDEAGLVGLIDVARVETDRSCRNFTYESVRARIKKVGARKDPAGAPLAIGPVTTAPTKARVVYPYDEPNLPPAGTSELYGAVDLDGDGKSDLVRYVFQCDKGKNRRPGAEDHCVEIWSRLGGESWTKTMEGEFPPCR